MDLYMDWKIFASTFTMIFLAEMGDKTQFAALAASAGTKSTYSVMIAVVLALSLAGILGVFAGKFLGSALNPKYMKWISGSMFIGIGTWILISKQVYE
jgi:putative Ca2+/H+ antiporter (TMEM165/GDT1 family)